MQWHHCTPPTSLLAGLILSCTKAEALFQETLNRGLPLEDGSLFKCVLYQTFCCKRCKRSATTIYKTVLGIDPNVVSDKRKVANVVFEILLSLYLVSVLISCTLQI